MRFNITWKESCMILALYSLWSVTSGKQTLLSVCATRLLPQWMLHWWWVNGSTARETFLYTSVANLAFFPRIWACFFLNLRFFGDLRVAIFGLVLFKNCLILGLFFANFLISGLLFCNCCVNFAVSFSWKSIVYCPASSNTGAAIWVSSVRGHFSDFCLIHCCSIIAQVQQ